MELRSEADCSVQNRFGNQWFPVPELSGQGILFKSGLFRSYHDGVCMGVKSLYLGENHHIFGLFMKSLF